MSFIPMSAQFKSTFDEFAVPEELQHGFWLYFMYGIDPGSFGLAILENDFATAVCKAHPSLEAEHLRHIAKWFMNVRLPKAYGSAEKINAWRKLTDEERKEIMENLRLCPTLFDILRSVPGPN